MRNDSECPTVLCLNAGSSSLKFAVFQAGASRPECRLNGAVAHLDSDRSRAWCEDGVTGDRRNFGGPVTGHEEAVGMVLETLSEWGHPEPLAVGHRVVHGGPRYAAPTRLDDRVLNDLRGWVPYAPLHQPHAIGVIEAVAARWPRTLQVACFDTAIHLRMPNLARRLPLPGWLWDEGVMRYGFHGLSYEYLLDQHPPLRRGRTVIAHLGHGASLGAFLDGEPRDTTMGLTPTGGLMMGTRSGDLDPGVVLYLMSHHGYRADQIDQLVNHDSGLKGVSGVSGDMQTLERRSDTNEQAAEAIEMFCRSVCRHVGAMAGVLGGLDRFVFTAGIGEHSFRVRDTVCRRLAFLGIEFDARRNRRHAGVITAPNSPCTVYVLPTDEQQMIARHTLAVLASG